MSASVDCATMANLFSHLGIEEPSSSPLGHHPNGSKKKKKQQQQHPRPDRSQNDQDFSLVEHDDTIFALWCFLEDLHDVRKSVRETWQEFADGDVSFLAASMVTDVAFGLMRCVDDEFTTTREHFKDHRRILSFRGLTITSRRHEIWLFPVEPGASPRLLDPRRDVTDLLCPAATMLLQGFELRFLIYMRGVISKKAKDSCPHTEVWTA